MNQNFRRNIKLILLTVFLVSNMITGFGLVAEEFDNNANNFNDNFERDIDQ